MNNCNNKSVYFYTLHKCASTLFSSFVLGHIKGLSHVDYESEIYKGTMSEDDLIFEENGYVYGPIRMQAKNSLHPIWRHVSNKIANSEFIIDKKSIFFIRDPRDILVSQYYSFGFTHGFSTVEEIKKMQENRRLEIKRQTIDEYVLSSVDSQIKKFDYIYKLANICEDSIILKYEDMINDFDKFIDELCSFVPIEVDIVNKIYKKTRPNKKENLLSHRRSGKTNGFRDKLNKTTIEQLNKRLAKVLNLFEYEI